MCIEYATQGLSLANGVQEGLTQDLHWGVGLGGERNRGERVGRIGKSKGGEDDENSAPLMPGWEAPLLVSVFSGQLW